MPATLGLLTWLRLARVFQKIERRATIGLRCSDVSLAQFDVLAHVAGRPGITQQELADSLLVTKGNICQLLDRMEREGVVERVQEGRTNRLRLTEKGQDLSCRIIPAHEARIEACLSALSRQDQADLHRLLRKLERALPELEPQAPPTPTHSTA